MPQRTRSHTWKQRVARERRRLERDPSLAVCWLCGQPIDMELPVHHERAFTLDHIIPVHAGGSDRTEAKPAHRSCNSEREKKRRDTTTLLDW